MTGQCPTCGKPIDPNSKVWITPLPESRMYHMGCAPRGKLLKYEEPA
jgi:hypothetical protein